jgi:predicted nucleic-acid-binding Zn-ribbon protein
VFGILKGFRDRTMECKNPHCKGTGFVPVIELDNNVLIGVKCRNCGARYSMDDIEIKESLKRDGWNSVKWGIKPFG